METQIKIANPSDHEFEDTLLLMSAGAYGDTQCLVWGNDCSAFEVFTEWLDDHAPGLLTSFDESDYHEAAKELKLDWQSSWPDYEDPDFERVVEATEVDHTTIGHTTLKCGATHIASHEWFMNEVTGDEWQAVKARSKATD